VTAPTTEITGLKDATERLLGTVGALDDDAIAQPSLLPGWTRGHVLAHIARNADALVNVLTGRPMYPSDEARNTAIERDAARPAAVHGEDIRESAARLEANLAALSGEEWQATVELRGGITDRVASIPFRRWVEVDLHHIDLGTGRTVADLPGAFLDHALDYLAARFSGRADLAAIELRAEDGRTWRTGGSGGPVAVVGAPADLVGWLTGRTSGGGLTTTRGEPLPALPPL
jgi:maleylpyruvate isomerase